MALTRVLAFGLAALAAVSALGQTALLETWEGQILLRSNWRYLEASFGGPDGPKVDQPQERGTFGNFKQDGNQLEWTLTRGAAVTNFRGTRTGSVIRGTAEQNGVAGEFQLVRTDRTRTSGGPGMYRTATGDLVSIARFDFGDGVNRLALMDTNIGYWGTLLPAGGSKYVLAPARSGWFPADVTLAFEGNAVAIQKKDVVILRARRFDSYQAKPVAFDNGSVHLGGEILLPRGEGKHPGIVMVHSSGHQSRNGPVAYFRLMANLLASSGYAVLIFDKRGVGESTGSWQSASLQDLAGDVQAAVRTLRNDAAVDGNRVGLWGISQGGWIAPIVAAEDARIAFLTLVSGAAITPAQQEIERVAMVMKANGSRQADIDAADRYLHTFFDVVAKVKPWSDLQSAMEQTANAPWLQYVPRPRNESQLGWTADFAGFDPAPVLGRVKAPILTFHGTDDVDVDARSNSALFARLAPNARSEHRIADGADHYMLSHVDDPDKESRRLVPQYWKSIIAWLARQR